MGLFKRFRKTVPPQIEDTTHRMNLTDRLDAVFPEQMETVQAQKIAGIDDVVDCCEQMLEANRQIEKMKAEYQAVTDYLSDMQKIDRIPAPEREKIEAAAKNLCRSVNEEDKYKQKDVKINALQKTILEKLENNIATDLKNMKKNEEYNGIVKGDLQHLEGEKGALLYEQEEIIKKQAFLKKMAVTMAVLVVSLFALIASFSFAFDQNMAVPYILTILMAAITATYIFFEENKSRRELKLCERKLQKAITLLNKVKIKYVNNRSLLEYSYEKYEVSGSVELEYNWKQYLIVKENDKKAESNKERLNLAKDELLAALARYELSDTAVWVHQAQAIFDTREMVQTRHRLNVRRQKLRDNLNYNTNTYIKNKKELLDFMERNKPMEEEIKDILRSYGLEL